MLDTSTAKTKFPAFIVTLGIFTYIRRLAYALSTGYPIALSDPLFKSSRYGTVFATLMPIFIVASVYVNAFFYFGYTMFDRHIYAVGGVEEAVSPTGGVGKIQGTIIGALIIGGLNNDLTLLVVDYYRQLVIKGAVIILTVPLDRLRSK
ncbi:ABC transporter permease [Priestia megaterium]|uniref:ABC transporter permease n=1 Tax=Priestia megaterium TaxID=1404 RepID=UPI0020424D84|nr:hypothetical protein [Priestia megaterium]MCM3099826.1 hypothetical protein [Priestia megaterium]